MRDKGPLFFNRELSWLEFNRRVLAEAERTGKPTLERLKFAVIAASNLDEFFMVRVGGLDQARKAGRRKKDIAGMTPVAQLRALNERVGGLVEELYGCFNNGIVPALEAAGIVHQSPEGWTQEQEGSGSALFAEELFPVITPMAVVPGRSFPLLRNLALHLLVRLGAPGRGPEAASCYAVLPLDRCGPRLIPLPTEAGYRYVLREEVVRKYVAQWFPGYTVEESVLFRITRNADFAVQEDEAPDLLAGMEDVLDERKTGDCVRLEVEAGISRGLLAFLRAGLAVDSQMVFRIQGPLDLGGFAGLGALAGFDELKAEPWPPLRPPAVVPGEPMFSQIARHELLFYHPYESFEPVVRFIEEAAEDPDTLAIKMVIYRTSAESPVVAALKRAAENGINVTVLMELKARFDEARNIGWVRELEPCGVQVVYGVRGYKTHSKICLVVRREPSGVVRYCHFGTGNYNEATARMYGDISYMTCDPALGEDASIFFNAVCGYSQPRRFNRISMSPVNMRDRLLELIGFETECAKAGRKAQILLKLNALVDGPLIRRLYEASQAGVRIQLNVRGICCLRPGIRGLSENITVTSVVDRYLEHARILYFHNDGRPRVFISSADWMPRNLDRRLELLIPVEERTCRNRLIEFLKLHLSDTTNAWVLQSDGTYRRAEPARTEVRSQRALYERVCEAVEADGKERRTRFEPYRGEK